MKKRILFLHESMDVGGITSALLAVLRLIPASQFDIYLLLRYKRGALIGDIPATVQVMEIPYNTVGTVRHRRGWFASFIWSIVHFHWIFAIRTLFVKVRWKVGRYRERYRICYDDIEADLLAACADQEKLPKDIDYAFAYITSGLNLKLINRYFQRANTAAWFHHGLMVVRFPDYVAALKKLKHLFACSQSIANVMNLEHTVVGLNFEVMPHLIDFERYRALAVSAETFLDDYTGLRILTVGRISEEKGVSDSLRVARILKNHGVRFRWYWLGGGALATSQGYMELRAKFGLEDDYVFIGEKINPFGFIRDCDIYVQPSHFEAYCLSVAEARAFNRPIVITNFASAAEHIKDGETGLIVPVGDCEGLASAIERLLADGGLRSRFSRNLQLIAADSQERARSAWSDLLI